MKKKMYYFQLLAMLIVLFLVYKIQLPDLDTVSVGVCYADSELGKEIFEDLRDAEGVFEYQNYSDAELLEADVLAGQLEGGFVFTESFDEGIRSGDTKDTILFYSTPFSLKTEVLKEMVYTEVFNYLSETMLYQIDVELYGNTEKQRQERLAEVNEWYLESDTLFKLEIVEVDLEDTESTIELESGNDSNSEKEESVFDMKTYPLQGTAGVLLFLIMYLAYSKKWEVANHALLKALTKGQQNCYMSMGMLASVTIPAVIMIAFAIRVEASRGILQEILSAVIFIIVSIVWINLLGKIIKSYTTYIGCGLAVLLANVILCPVFVDLSTIIPAIKYIRMLLPLGWYFIS